MRKPLLSPKGTRELERIGETRLKALRSEIALGIEQGNKGEVIDGEEVFRELREDIYESLRVTFQASLNIKLINFFDYYFKKDT